MKKLLIWIGIVTTLLGFGLNFGCQGEQSKTTFRIGLGPWIGFGPFYLAKEKGLFREAGIQVEFITLTGLAERNSALKSGKIHGLAAPVDYFVMSAGNRVNTTIVMAIDESIGGDGIVAKKHIKSFEDLRGKRVAFQKGFPSEFFLRALLERNKLNMTELETVDMETAQAGAAFLSNNLDAAVLWEPWLTKAKEDGKGHILASTRDHRNLIVDTLAFNTRVVSESGEEVQKIVNALLKAIEFAKNFPDKANRIMAPHFQLDVRKYKELLDGLAFADLNRNREYFGSSENPGPIYSVAEQASVVWRSAGVISKPVNSQRIILSSFIENASMNF